MSTATATKLTREVKPTPIGIGSEVWHSILKSVDPLSEWRQEFAELKRDIELFRTWESQGFFHTREDELSQHVHRGWLSSLICGGEMLAVNLLQSGHKDSASDEFRFLNLLLENLQQTLETWHSAARHELQKEEKSAS